MRWKGMTVLVAAFLCLSLCGCLRLEHQFEPLQREHGDPTWYFDTLVPHMGFDGADRLYEIDFELDYDGITASVAQTEIPCDARSIEVTVGNTSGRAFYFYQKPKLEYDNNGQWAEVVTGRVDLYHDYELEGGWNIMLPDHPDSHTVKIDLNNASFAPSVETENGTVTKPIPGRYRITVFTPLNDVYIYLTMTEPEGRSNEDPVWNYDSLTPQESFPSKFKEIYESYGWERDYGSVSATVAQDKISCEAEFIEVNVDNSDELVFWVYSLPYIEYRDGDQWRRMLIDTSVFDPEKDMWVEMGEWTSVIPENGGCEAVLELPLSRAKFDLPLQTEDGVFEKPVPGQYRIVVFTPVGEIYIPLTLE
ncbi:MAG: hypothetical protein IKM04_01655 [Clostridia bacterium]|nr:hypothetical protein [Clostridia bacterium]